MNSPRWIALHCGDEAQTLLADFPNAFLLPLQIAIPAKWKDCPITGLREWQAYIGDWEKVGLRSLKVYQMVMERLEKCRLASFQGGNRGTLATLTDTTVFSITKDAKGQPEGKLGDSKGTAKGQQRDSKGTPEGHLGDTNHTDTLITKSTMITKHTTKQPSSSSQPSAEALLPTRKPRFGRFDPPPLVPSSTRVCRNHTFA